MKKLLLLLIPYIAFWQVDVNETLTKSSPHEQKRIDKPQKIASNTIVNTSTDTAKYFRVSKDLFLNVGNLLSLYPKGYRPQWSFIRNDFPSSFLPYTTGTSGRQSKAINMRIISFNNRAYVQFTNVLGCDCAAPLVDNNGYIALDNNVQKFTITDFKKAHVSPSYSDNRRTQEITSLTCGEGKFDWRLHLSLSLTDDYSIKVNGSLHATFNNSFNFTNKEQVWTFSDVIIPNAMTPEKAFETIQKQEEVRKKQEEVRKKQEAEAEKRKQSRMISVNKVLEEQKLKYSGTDCASCLTQKREVESYTYTEYVDKYDGRDPVHGFELYSKTAQQRVGSRAFYIFTNTCDYTIAIVGIRKGDDDITCEDATIIMPTKTTRRENENQNAGFEFFGRRVPPSIDPASLINLKLYPVYTDQRVVEYSRIVRTANSK